MKKFIVLVKKEIMELLTPQMIVPLLAVVLVFFFIGKQMNKEVAKSNTAQPIALEDLDNSEMSKLVIETFSKSNLNVQTFSGDVQDAVSSATGKGQKAVVVIPQGFQAGIENSSPQKIEVYSLLNNFSIMGMKSATDLSSAMAQLNAAISNQLLSAQLPGKNILALKQPVGVNDFTVVGNKQANVSPAAVMGFISSQTTFIPIILFLVIMLAAQLVVTSIASEKENKTLETLLSCPVSRRLIVAAKLVGAGIVALFTAAIYIFGMRSYMNGLTGMSQPSAAGAGIDTVVRQLGLTFTAGDYVTLGLSLFFGILVALSLAVILGSFAEDVKSAQGVIAPLMILILIPYFLTLFLDINSLSPAMKILVYAIPFSHTFVAAPNIFLGHTLNLWLGILYMAIVFVVFVIIAARIFASEKILTMKLNFRRKK
jgi:ABC-2 type transport system permease protein